VGDTVGDDASLATTRAGEYKKRPLAEFDGLALAGIEAGEEVHQN
jgi:hypothetical protein